MRTASLALVMIAACSSSSPKPAPPTTNGSSDVQPSSTGPLSEEEFKAMHSAAPAPGTYERQGTEIDLKGTKAYLSVPKGPGPFPAIVVIHEWWGKNAHIEHWADRLATAGWAAIAVDLYGGVVATDKDGAMAAMKSVDDTKAAATISAALEYVSMDPKIKAPRKAVIGWCFGGGWSLKTALGHPELSGAIIYYGQLETDAAKLAPIKAKVLGVFANKDKGIPPATVDAFEAGLKQANIDAKIYRYDAEHAFANPSNPIYDEKSASDAWSHVLEFLASLGA
jgi:carboxymethylenebutenolidase